MVLLLGTGYIGSAIQDECERREIECRILRPAHSITFESLWHWLSQNRPAVVFNAAALVCHPSVDFNEDYRFGTIQANTVFPETIACACEATGTPLLHISTGCLYQGDAGGSGWLEDDAPQLTMDTGAGTYVASKHISEYSIRRHEQHWICRIRLPFDEFDHPRNLLTKLQRFTTIVEETQSLTHRGDFAKAVIDIWAKRLPWGTYHCTNPGAISYRALVNEINQRLHGGVKTFSFVTPEQFDRTARTVKSRCVLNTDKLRDAGVVMRSCGEAVVDSLRNWVPMKG